MSLAASQERRVGVRNPIVRDPARGIRRYYRPSLGRRHRHKHGDSEFTHRHVSDYYDYTEIHEPGVAYTPRRTLGGRFTGLPLGAVATGWQERDLPRDRQLLSPANFDLDFLDQDDLDLDYLDTDDLSRSNSRSRSRSSSLDYLDNDDISRSNSRSRSRSSSQDDLSLNESQVLKLLKRLL